MRQTAPKTEESPAPPEASVSCPTCGAATRRAYRRGPDGLLHGFLICRESGELVAALPHRPAATGWVGWFRPGKREPWRQLVSASTHDEAWGLLLDALADQRGGDSTVLAAGIDPNEGASARREPR